MSSLDRLNRYLEELEARLRLAAWTRGAAVFVCLALATTLLLVLYSNAFAFSARSLTAARFALVVVLACGVVFALIGPLLRLTRRAAARRAEHKFPEFQERLLTVAEKSGSGEPNPFLELVAADAWHVAQAAEPAQLVPRVKIAASISAAVCGAGALIWLIAAGPGFWGHGAALLWGSTPKSGIRPFYDIQVLPGDATVRKGGDQLITTVLTGFEAPRVRLMARYASASKWEEAAMMPRESAPGYEFLFASLGEAVDYYVEAGGLKSHTFRLNVMELPAIKRMRVTYRFPGWVGVKDAVQERGGDLRAVEGTEADVAIEFDRPLRDGVLVLNGDTRIPLRQREGNWYAATVPVREDGLYHAAAIEEGKAIRLSEEYFIEVRKETPPVVRITRPGRDAKVSPIEEVTVDVLAEDDFALDAVELRYSVNGGPEKAVSMLPRKGEKQASGSTMISLEDFKLVPGDVVSLYATARDARSTSKTDMFFVEAQPYEREYTQSQVSGGEGGEGGEGERQNEISRRQKEIIAATWNQSRNNSGSRAAAAENAKFLSEVQSKLRDQARSLSKRMKSRELAQANEEFSSFSKDMDAAADAMNSAVDKLKAMNWKEALPAEQRALQHLLRAEATFRQIQVAFGRQSGRGGGQGGGGRDLENLFDLELDTEKNQYEAGQQSASSDQRQREVDEALQKLERLARRQQELAAQQRQQNQQSFQQRWQQEMLRREAEQLQRQMEQLARNSSQSQSQSQSQQSQQSQSGQSSSQSQQQSQQQSRQQSGQSSQTSQRLSSMAGRQTPGEQRLRQALDELRRATEDMRRAGAESSNASDARRAAERLQQARDMVGGMRRQDAAAQLEDLASRSSRLAEQQKEFAEKLKQAYGQQGAPSSQVPQFGENKVPQERLNQMGAEKQGMLDELQKIEKDMQAAARDLAGTQRGASNKLREGLAEMQQNELAVRMRFGAEWVRRGYGPMIGSREALVSQGLERLRDRIRSAQNALDKAGTGQESLEQSLAQVEQLRRQLEAARAEGQPGQRSQQGQPAQQGQPGQQGQQGQQNQQGQPGQQRGGGGGRLNGDWARQLGELRRNLSANPELRHDGIDGLRNLEAIDPNRVTDITKEILPALRQLELSLRRKLEEKQSGQVRSAAGEPIPPGYSGAVADYFRRLSKP